MNWMGDHTSTSYYQTFLCLIPDWDGMIRTQDYNVLPVMQKAANIAHCLAAANMVLCFWLG
jgi:hypothetical protein